MRKPTGYWTKTLSRIRPRHWRPGKYQRSKPRSPQFEPLERRELLAGDLLREVDDLVTSQLIVAPAAHNTGDFTLTHVDWTGKETGGALYNFREGLAPSADPIDMADNGSFQAGQHWSFTLSQDGVLMGIQFDQFSLLDADRAWLTVGDNDPIEVHGNRVDQGHWRPPGPIEFAAGDTLRLEAIPLDAGAIQEALTAREDQKAEFLAERDELEQAADPGSAGAANRFLDLTPEDRAERIADIDAAIIKLDALGAPEGTWRVEGLFVFGADENTHGGYIDLAHAEVRRPEPPKVDHPVPASPSFAITGGSGAALFDVATVVDTDGAPQAIITPAAGAVLAEGANYTLEVRYHNGQEWLNPQLMSVQPVADGYREQLMQERIEKAGEALDERTSTALEAELSTFRASIEVATDQSASDKERLLAWEASVRSVIDSLAYVSEVDLQATAYALIESELAAVSEETGASAETDPVALLSSVLADLLMDNSRMAESVVASQALALQSRLENAIHSDYLRPASGTGQVDTLALQKLGQAGTSRAAYVDGPVLQIGRHLRFDLGRRAVVTAAEFNGSSPLDPQPTSASGEGGTASAYAAVEEWQSLFDQFVSSLGELPAGTSTAGAPGVSALAGGESDYYVEKFNVDPNDNTQLRLIYDSFSHNPGDTFDISIYRSADGVNPTGDPLLTKRITTQTGGGLEYFPADFTDVREDYYLLAVIDAGLEIDEADETNNFYLFEGGLFFDESRGIVHVQTNTGSADTVTISDTVPGTISVTLNGVPTNFLTANVPVNEIHIRTHINNDTIDVTTASFALPIWAFGGAGNDNIDGGAAGDFLEGGHGIDTVYGRDGADEIHGDFADDPNSLQGNGDYLYGQDGDDDIYGGYGADLIDGGWGDDELHGGREKELPFGFTPDPWGAGGTGGGGYYDGGYGDWISGGDGDDVIHGDDGNDYGYGGFGADTIHGGAGDDYLFGDAGNGAPSTTSDDDVLHGDVGDDLLEGEQGNDTYVFSGSAHLGTDTLRDSFGQGSDTFDFSLLDAPNGVQINLYSNTFVSDMVNITFDHSLWPHIENVTGTAYDDILAGNGRNNTFAGGAGNDTYIFAGIFDQGLNTIVENPAEGTDTIDFSALDLGIGITYDLRKSAASYVLVDNGSSQMALDTSTLPELENVIATNYSDTIMANPLANTLTGLAGNDTLWGFSGDDIIHGGLGNDRLFGENGNDTLEGEDGDDYLDGGKGDDDLIGGAGFDYPEIVDDGDGGFQLVGDWLTAGVDAGFNTDQLTPTLNLGSESATWTFSNLAAGSYGLFTTWVADASTRNGTYTVREGGVQLGAPVELDQTIDPPGIRVQSQPWHALGEYALTTSSLEVELTDGTSGNMLADAVWLVAAPTTTGIANVTVQESADNYSIDLTNVFADPQEADIALAVTVADNDRWDLFDRVSLDPTKQFLVLDFADEAFGVATITVQAVNAFGLSVSTQFTVTIEEVDMAATLDAIDLVSDTGASDTDRYTGNPMISGVVDNDDDFLEVTLEFDHNNDDIVDGTATVDENRQFFYQVLTWDDLQKDPGGVPLDIDYVFDDFRVRTREPDSINGGDVISTWQPLESFTISISENLAPTVDGASLVLVNDTGASQTDEVTADPTIRGEVQNDGAVLNLNGDTNEGLWLDFDHAGDGSVDASVQLTSGVETFVYAPQGIPSDPNDDFELNVRVREWDRLLEEFIEGSWTLIDFRYDETHGDTPADLTFDVLNMTEGGSTTVDPTVHGHVTNDGDDENLLIEIDYSEPGTTNYAPDEDVVIDAVVYTDENGDFTYFPSGLDYELNGLRARVVEQQYGNADPVYSDWEVVSFTLHEAQAGSITSLNLTNDTGTNGDDITYDPTVDGTIQGDWPLELARVEFDYDGDWFADSSTVADDMGDFEHVLTMDYPGAFTVTARVVQFDPVKGEELVGAWYSPGLGFTLEPWSGPTISGFGLLNDTGMSGDDKTTDPTVTGQVESPFDVAFAVVEFDYDGDGIVDDSTLADETGSFDYLAQATFGSTVSGDDVVFNLRARAQSAMDDSDDLVIGDWAPYSFTLEPLTAPDVTLSLANDDGEYNDDDKTSDPTLTGTVGTGADYAYTTVEFDFDGDEVPDAAAVADINGVFYYTAHELSEGAVTVRARASIFDVGGNENIYGNWQSLPMERLPIDADADIPSVDAEEEATHEAAEFVVKMGDVSYRAAVLAAINVYHSILPGGGSGAIDLVVGDYDWMSNLRGDIMPTVGSYNVSNGLYLEDGLIPAFMPHDLASVPSDFSHDSPNLDPLVDLPSHEFDDVATTYGTYDLDLWIEVDIDYQFDDVTDTFAVSILIDMDYTYVETGSHSSAIYGTSTHPYTHTQDGEYVFVFTANGDFDDSGASVSLLADEFSATEDGDYSFSHHEDTTYSSSTGGASSGGSVTQDTTGEYHFDHGEFGNDGLPGLMSFSADGSDIDVEADFNHDEDGFTSLTTTNNGTYSYTGSANSFNSNDFLRVETRGFAFDYSEDGDYVIDDASRTVWADNVGQSTTINYSLSVSDSVSFDYDHADHSQDGNYTILEDGTHDTTQTEVGNYVATENSFDLTLTQLQQDSSGSHQEIKDEQGSRTYTNPHGFESGSYDRYESSTYGWTYGESLLPGVAYTFTDLLGAVTGTYAKTESGTTTVNFSSSGSHEYDDTRLSRSGSFDRSATAYGTSTETDDGTYTASFVASGLNSYAVGQATVLQNNNASFSYSSDGSMSETSGDTTTTGDFDQQVTGSSTSSYDDTAGYAQTPAITNTTGSYHATDDSNSSLSLSSTVVTEANDGTRTSHVQETVTYSGDAADSGSYTATGSVSEREGTVIRDEVEQLDRSSDASGTYITSAPSSSETHTFTDEEVVNTSSYFSESANYTETSSGRSSDGTAEREETRYSSGTLEDTVEYTRGERDGTSVLTETNIGSYSYSDSGTFSDDPANGYSISGEFSRLETGDHSRTISDTGTYSNSSSTGSYTTNGDVSATDVHDATGGTFSEDTSGRTEAASFTREEMRLTSSDTVDEGQVTESEDTTVSGTVTTTNTTTTLSASLSSTSTVAYDEAGSYLDQPGTRSSQASFTRSEDSYTTASSSATANYSGSSGSEVPSGSAVTTSSSDTDRFYDEDGSYTDVNGAITKNGTFFLTELTTSENTLNDDNTVTTDESTVTNHFNETISATIYYFEDGTFDDTPAGIDRQADFTRDTYTERTTTTSAVDTYKADTSAGKSTFVDEGTITSTFTDDGNYSTSPDGTARVGTQRSLDDGTGTVSFTDSGNYRNGSYGSYSTEQTGSRSDSLSQTTDYTERTGFSSGENGTTKTGKYDTQNGNKSDENGSGRYVILGGGSIGFGNHATTSNELHTYSEGGTFTESDASDTRNATFSQIDEEYVSNTLYQTVGYSKKVEHGTHSGNISTKQTGTTSHSYTESGTISDLIGKQGGITTERKRTADYTQKDTELRDVETVVSETKPIYVVDSASGNPPHYLDGFWEEADAEDHRVADGYSFLAGYGGGPFGFGPGPDAPVTGDDYLSTSLSSSVDTTYEVTQGQYEIVNGVTSDSYSYTDDSTTITDSEAKHTTTVNYHLDESANGHSVDDSVSASHSSTETSSETLVLSSSGSYESYTGSYSESVNYTTTEKRLTYNESTGSGTRNINEEIIEFGSTDTFDHSGEFSSAGTETTSYTYSSTGSYTEDTGGTDTSSSSFSMQESQSASSTVSESAGFDANYQGFSRSGEAHDVESNSYSHSYSTSGQVDDSVEDSTEVLDESKTYSAQFDSHLDHDPTSSFTRVVTVDETYDLDGTTTPDGQGGDTTDESWTYVIVSVETLNGENETSSSHMATNENPAGETTIEEGPKPGFWEDLLNKGQTVLDVAGFIPGIGIAADLLNAGIHLARGNYADAALNVVGAVPLVGDAIKAGAKGVKAATKAVDAAVLGGRVAKGVSRTADAAKAGMRAGRNVVNAGVHTAGNAARRASRAVGSRIPKSKCDIPIANRVFKWCFAPGTQVVVVGATAQEALAQQQLLVAAGLTEDSADETHDAVLSETCGMFSGILLAGAVGLAGWNVSREEQERREKKKKQYGKKPRRRQPAADPWDELFDEDEVDELFDADLWDEEGETARRVGPISPHEAVWSDEGAWRLVPAASSATAPSAVLTSERPSSRRATLGRHGSKHFDLRAEPSERHESKRSPQQGLLNRMASSTWSRRLWLLLWMSVVGWFLWSGLSPSESQLPDASLASIAAPDQQANASALNLASQSTEEEFGAIMYLEADEQSAVQDDGDSLTTKSIEDIKVGDIVLARDEETGELVPKRVTQLFRNISNHLRILKIEIANGETQELRTTDEHPFWVPEQGWINAGELEVGTKLYQANGDIAEIYASIYEPHPEGTLVFNFEVEDAHTYFVSEHAARGPPTAAIWVHNRCKKIADAKHAKFKFNASGDAIHVKAKITKKFLDSGTKVSSKIRKALKPGVNDDAGHILAKVLGGPGRTKLNAFAQIAKKNRGEMAALERKIAQSVRNTGKAAQVSISLARDGDKVTKVIYRFRLAGQGGWVEKTIGNL